MQQGRTFNCLGRGRGSDNLFNVSDEDSDRELNFEEESDSDVDEALGEGRGMGGALGRGRGMGGALGRGRGWLVSMGRGRGLGWRQFLDDNYSDDDIQIGSQTLVRTSPPHTVEKSYLAPSFGSKEPGSVPEENETQSKKPVVEKLDGLNLTEESDKDSNVNLPTTEKDSEPPETLKATTPPLSDAQFDYESTIGAAAVYSKEEFEVGQSLASSPSSSRSLYRSRQTSGQYNYKKTFSQAILDTYGQISYTIPEELAAEPPSMRNRIIEFQMGLNSPVHRGYINSEGRCITLDVLTRPAPMPSSIRMEDNNKYFRFSTQGTFTAPSSDSDSD